MTSGVTVPTDKQRASTYLETAKFEKVNRLAEEDGLSVSAWIEKVIDEYTTEGAVVVTFPMQVLEKLISLSESEFRDVEDQIKKVIIEWLRNQEPSENLLEDE